MTKILSHKSLFKVFNRASINREIINLYKNAILKNRKSNKTLKSLILHFWRISNGTFSSSFTQPRGVFFACKKGSEYGSTKATQTCHMMSYSSASHVQWGSMTKYSPLALCRCCLVDIYLIIVFGHSRSFQVDKKESFLIFFQFYD